jgi:hypothetical protein
MQPTFTLDVPCTADEAISRIRRAIRDPELNQLVESAGACVDFKIEPDDRRFWSPHLSVQLNDTESGSQLYGRFSPRPEIWTMFMAIYFMMATVIFGAAILAYVQWFLGSKPWALLLVPIGIAIILGLHLASLVGQGLSSDQMTLLRTRLDRTLAIAFADDPIARYEAESREPVGNQ